MFSPARGWDSYDAFPVWSNPNQFNETLLLEQAALQSQYNSSGGFNYFIIDEGWAESDFAWILDDYGRPTVNPDLFPSAAGGQGFLPLATTLKQQYGLDLGLWLIKGITKQAVEMNLPVLNTQYTARDIYIKDKVCEWHKDVYWVNVSHPGGAAFYRSVAELYGSWGVKYLKIDCIFGERDTDPLEVKAFANAVVSTPVAGDPVFLSLSPGKGANLAEGSAIGEYANAYRITDDLWDCWIANTTLCPDGTSVINATYTLRDWAPQLQARQKNTAFGSFADPDMLALGVIGLGSFGRHVSWITKENMGRYVYGMWTITQSPIILGGDWSSIKSFPWLDGMLRNPMLRDVSRCSGKPFVSLFVEPDADGNNGVVVWTAPHGVIVNAFYAGFFAFSTNSSAGYSQLVSVPWTALGVKFSSITQMLATDLFAQAQVGVLTPTQNGTFSVTVGANDAQMILFMPY
jgi:alpha-galactosidase